MRVKVVDGQDGARALAAEFDRTAGLAPEETRKVVAKGALNVKQDWARRWSGLAHAPALPSSITYDLARLGDRVSAEVGPDRSRRQAALGNLFEFGSLNNAPIPGGAPALEAEAPRFEAALQNLVVDVLEQRR